MTTQSTSSLSSSTSSSSTSSSASSMDACTAITLGQAPVLDVHPLVVLAVLEQYSRRPSYSFPTVCGALLGFVSSGRVDITNSFALPMPLDDPKDFSRAYEAAAALYDRANPREQVVGWYVTVSQSGVSHLPDVCVPLHSFFGNRVALPVVVAVDTSMHAGKVAVRGYMTQTLVLREMQSASDGSDSTTVVHVAGTRFTEVTTNLKTNAVEIAALDALRHASSGVSPYSASNTTSSGSSGSRMPYLGLDVLGDLVSEVLQYVEDVVAGKEVADAALGRAVADALAAVSVGPQEEEAFEKAFAALVTDMAMVMYLTQMTKAQIGLAEKLVLASAERVGFEKPARADAAVEGAAAEGGAVAADE